MQTVNTACHILTANSSIVLHKLPRTGPANGHTEYPRPF